MCQSPRNKSREWSLGFPMPSGLLVTITAIFFFLLFTVCFDRWENGLKKTVSFSDFPTYLPMLFRDPVAIHIPMFGDLSLLLFEVKVHCTGKASFWQTSLYRHCIFMSMLLSYSAYLIFIDFIHFKGCIFITKQIHMCCTVPQSFQNCKMFNIAKLSWC